MSNLSFDRLSYDKFTIEILGNTIKFSGCIDLQDPEPVVTPFFNKIHEQIVKQEIKEVNLDFKELNFLNSSGIKTITKWIMKITILPDTKKYKMKLKIGRAHV
jgi:hypothetical protein